jgi:hypothetical protein
MSQQRWATWLSRFTILDFGFTILSVNKPLVNRQSEIVNEITVTGQRRTCTGFAVTARAIRGSVRLY